jgi:hypothetical protein
MVAKIPEIIELVVQNSSMPQVVIAEHSFQAIKPLLGKGSGLN